VRLGELPPHIFALGDVAYRDMLEFRRPQAMIISGESGAGKTETMKLLLQYLSSLTATHSAVEQRILESNPVLEAFGNAKTVWNDNSSRFGKFINVFFDSDGYIAGASINQYLLEKSRLTAQGEGERNFHVFYAMMAGLGDEEKEELRIGDPSSYRYLGGATGTRERAPGFDETREFERIQGALESLKVDDDTQLSLWRTVSAVLNIGQLVFEADGEGSKVSSTSVAADVAALLCVAADALVAALTTREMSVAGSKMTLNLKLAEAQETADALAKTIYAAIFVWLVGHINRNIATGSRDDERSLEASAAAANAAYKSDTMKRSTNALQSIGILDIFGFESFTTNSLEQVLINLCNEKLQSLFTATIFKIEQSVYEAEGISWAQIDYSDNAATLELFEAKMGVATLLDEETRFPKATDQTFLDKLASQHKDHPSLSFPKTARNQFTIRHYAGEVSYTVDGFLDKNRDTLQPSILGVLQTSTDPLIKELADELAAAAAAAAGGGGGAKKKTKTIFGQFKEQLNELMATLGATNAHYVRCVKPNTRKTPGAFEDPVVESQLRYSGMLETIRIRKVGYPIRQDMATFVARYAVVLSTVPGSDAVATSKAILATLDAALANEHQVGKTKVFLRQAVFAALEDSRLAGLERQAITLQAFFRMALERKRYLATRRSIILAQAMARRWLALTRYRRQRTVLIRLQATQRSRVERRAYLAQRRAVLVVQARVRGARAAAAFGRQQTLARLVIAAARGYLDRREYVLSRDEKARKEAEEREAAAKAAAQAAEEARVRAEAEAAAKAAAEAKAAADAEAAAKAAAEAKAAEAKAAAEAAAKADAEARQRETFEAVSDAPVSEEARDAERARMEAQEKGASPLLLAEIAGPAPATAAGVGAEETETKQDMGGEDLDDSRWPEELRGLSTTRLELRSLAGDAEFPEERAPITPLLADLVNSIYDTMQTGTVKYNLEEFAERYFDVAHGGRGVAGTGKDTIRKKESVKKAASAAASAGLTTLRGLKKKVDSSGGSLGRRGSSAADSSLTPLQRSLRHSHKPLKGGMLAGVNPKAAQSLSSAIFAYAGEAGAEHQARAEAPEIARHIMGIGLNSQLSSVHSIEVFVQLMRQIMHCPDASASRRYWSLLVVACGTVLPRIDEFVPYLLQFLVAAAGAGPPHAKSAMNAVDLLQRTLTVPGSRAHPPSNQEIDCLLRQGVSAKDMRFTVSIHTPVEAMEPVRLDADSQLTAGEAFNTIVNRFGILDPSNFGLYARYNHLEKPVGQLERLADAVSLADFYKGQLIQQAKANGESALGVRLDFRFVFKVKRFLAPRSIVSNDTVQNRVIAAQVRTQVMRADLVIRRLADAVKFAALELHATRGDCPVDSGTIRVKRAVRTTTTVSPPSPLSPMRASASEKGKASKLSALTLRRGTKKKAATPRTSSAADTPVAVASRTSTTTRIEESDMKLDEFLRAEMSELVAVPTRRIHPDVTTEEWATKVKEAWRSLTGSSPNEVAIETIRIAATSPLFGSFAATCHHDSGMAEISANFKLFVSIRGIHVADANAFDTATTLGRWSQLRDWIYTDQSVKLYFEKKLGQVTAFVFSSGAAAEIGSLITEYVNYLRALSTRCKATGDVVPRPEEVEQGLVTATAGEILTIVDRADTHWLRVRRESGEEGYIDAQLVEILIEDSASDALAGAAGMAGKDPLAADAERRAQATRLPPARFNILAFGAQWLRGCSTPADAAAVLAHTRDPIKESLLRIVEERRDQESAIRAFRLVLAAMGEGEMPAALGDQVVGFAIKAVDAVERRKAAAAAAKAADSGAIGGGSAAIVDGDEALSVELRATKALANLGIRAPRLRDEIFMQVVKQLSNNQSPASARRGWVLLAALLRTFMPTPEFGPYLKVFCQLDDVAIIGGVVDESVRDAATFALVCMHYKFAPRLIAPPADELRALGDLSLAPLSTKVLFPNGDLSELKYTGASTATEATMDLLKANPALSGSMMSMCENAEGGLMLPPDRLVADVVSHWETHVRPRILAGDDGAIAAQLAALGAGGVDVAALKDEAVDVATVVPLIAKRKMFLPDPATGLIPELVPARDDLAAYAFHAAYDDVRFGRLIFDADGDAPYLAALSIRAVESEEKLASIDMALLARHIPGPVLRARPFEEWNEELQFHLAPDGIVRSAKLPQVHRWYLETVTKHPLYGSIVFWCEKRSKLTKSVTRYPVALRYDGVHVCKAFQAKPEKTYAYGDITNFATEPGIFTFFAGSLMDPIKVALHSPYAQDMYNSFLVFYDVAQQDSGAGVKKAASAKDRRLASQRLTLAGRADSGPAAPAKPAAPVHKPKANLLRLRRG
jgi:hypothetical protein